MSPNHLQPGFQQAQDVAGERPLHRNDKAVQIICADVLTAKTNVPILYYGDSRVVATCEFLTACRRMGTVVFVYGDTGLTLNEEGTGSAKIDLRHAVLV